MNRALVKTGVIGSIVAGICCFTPVLVVLLAATGLSAIVGYLDYVLLPALSMFILFIFVGILGKTRTER